MEMDMKMDMEMDMDINILKEKFQLCISAFSITG
jgi:hypothetical protein